ncbi:MAG: hypothetical protein KAU28_11275 [Phycisphaerae bacterium]|nr:hypothetical protein [Phycisphaerae bacterium]
MAGKLLILTLLLAAALGGCNHLAYWLYLVAPPEPTKTVEAEFADLADSKVAIAIFADEGVQYEYPFAQLELSLIIADELKKHVKKIEVVNPRRVVKYQGENIYWDKLDRTELGRKFEADYVLYVSLVEFSTREPGSINLYRGRIIAESSVYKTSLPERQARVWVGEEIRVTHPPHAPTSLLSENDREIRYLTERLFAEKLVKNFYKHKVPKK